ncbi:MarR family transcriptional regulator [Kribbella antibiotica]|uniref:MarR family transcriptional regulator n=1 Tax=Kribbella antibiotica TaxID=190195 RepID=A0A4R4Z8N5_9ACTN|nr:MarR family transcriptional regulator [Kribbella antibiotica]TDD53564.1 MarR family transcriptional regulator [Kribbella antibiotica]
MQLAQQPLVPGVERDASAQDLMEGVSALIRAVRCIEHKHLMPGASNLRRADASVLKVLMTDGEQRGKELAAKLGVDASVVSRQLATLEADGLVSRRPDPADARVGLVRVSDDGKARLEAMYSAYTKQLRSALADFDDDALGEAAGVLKRLAHAVTEAADSVRRSHTTGD